MTPISVIAGHIPAEILTRFKEIRTFVENMSDIEGEVLTCHSICKAVATLHPDFLYVEGTFGDIYNHSWLVSKQHPQVILDMYPVAGASPFIVYAGISLLPWFRLYEKKPVKYDKEILERQVQKILQQVR